MFGAPVVVGTSRLSRSLEGLVHVESLKLEARPVASQSGS